MCQISNDFFCSRICTLSQVYLFYLFTHNLLQFRFISGIISPNSWRRNKLRRENLIESHISSLAVLREKRNKMKIPQILPRKKIVGKFMIKYWPRAYNHFWPTTVCASSLTLFTTKYFFCCSNSDDTFFIILYSQTPVPVNRVWGLYGKKRKTQHSQPRGIEKLTWFWN